MTKSEYLSHLDYLSSVTGMPEETANDIRRTAEDVFSNPDFAKAAETVDTDMFAGEYAIGEEMAEYADKFGYSGGVFGLFMAVYHSVKTKANYISAGIDLTVYADTMKDMFLYTKHEGDRIANDLYKWLVLDMKEKVYRIGRFEYQPSKYKGEEIVIDGHTVKNGDFFLNLHIPKGEALTDEVRLDSYRRAYDFFGFKEDAVYICESWLLYRENLKMLPPTSNIVKFIGDFTLIDTHESHDMEEMWRIFGDGMDYTKPETLPRDSTVRRAYADRIAKGMPVGESTGVIIFRPSAK